MSGTTLALVTDAFGGRGGIAQYNRDFLTALADAGVGSPVAVLPRYAPDRVELGDNIKQYPAKSDRFGYALRVLQLGFTRRIGIVFCGHQYMAPLALLIARLRLAKLIIQVHGIEAWRQPSRLQRMAVDAADLVLCVSRHTRRCVLQWTTIAPERVLVLPNTVGEAFMPDAASSLRAELGLEGKRILLTVGRLDTRERYKGHDGVIAAIPPAVAAGHDVVYVIVGEGDDRARLEAQACALGVADRVRFIGASTQRTLQEAYRMADLFVMPSAGEGFGIVFLEAMASGTPALGLAAGGAPDALADGELGLLVGEADLSAALIRALNGPKPDAQSLASAVRRRFGRDRFVGHVRAICGRLDGVVPTVGVNPSQQPI